MTSRPEFQNSLLSVARHPPRRGLPTKPSSARDRTRRSPSARYISTTIRRPNRIW